MQLHLVARVLLLVVELLLRLDVPGVGVAGARALRDDEAVEADQDPLLDVGLRVVVLVGGVEGRPEDPAQRVRQACRARGQEGQLALEPEMKAGPANY